MIHFIFGAVTTALAYILIRGLARFLMSEAAADWMDHRAMLAQAESDAIHAAQDKFRVTCAEWGKKTVAGSAVAAAPAIEMLAEEAQG